MDKFFQLGCSTCSETLHPLTKVCLLGHNCQNYESLKLQVKKSKINDFVFCLLQSLNNCKWLGNTQDVISHCRQYHRNNVCLTSKQSFALANFFQSKLSYYHVIFETYQRLFNSTVEVNFDTGFVTWHISCLATLEETEDYYFKVFLRNQNTGEEVYQAASCQVMNGSCMAKGRMYALIDLSVARRFCVQGKLFYTICICNEDRNLSICNIENIDEDVQEVIYPQPSLYIRNSQLPNVSYLRQLKLFTCSS